MSGVFDLRKRDQRQFIRKLNSGTDVSVQAALRKQHARISEAINKSFDAGEDSAASGMNPLTYATKNHRVAICEMLVEEFGADPSQQDKNGQTAIEIARESGFTELLEFFRAQSNIAADPEPEPSRPVSDSKPPVDHISEPHHDDPSDIDEQEESKEDMKEPENSDIPPFERPFELFTNVTKLQRLYKKLRKMKQSLLTHETCVTREMKSKYNQDVVRTILNDIRDFYEEEKNRLRNKEYFNSMLEKRKERGFDFYFRMNIDYLSAWIDAYNHEDEKEYDGWNDNIDEILEEVNKKRVQREKLKYEICQPIFDFVQIYPFAIVTQNRVNEVVTRLAQRTNAEEGLYLPEDGPKSLDRAFEKAAFCPYESRLYKADIWDFCRGLITYSCLSDILEAIDLFNKFTDVTVINISSSFHKKPPIGQDPRTASMDWNSTWQDVKLHFWFNDDLPRLICELQLCLTFFTEKRRAVKKNCGGHQAYSKFRCLDEIERYMTS